VKRLFNKIIKNNEGEMERNRPVEEVELSEIKHSIKSARRNQENAAVVEFKKDTTQ
jgi:hypothetical protein